jgi:hypothetical protein
MGRSCATGLGGTRDDAIFGPRGHCRLTKMAGAHCRRVERSRGFCSLPQQGIHGVGLVFAGDRLDSLKARCRNRSL